MTVPRIKENHQNILKRKEDTDHEREVEIEIELLKVINIRGIVLEIRKDEDKNLDDRNHHLRLKGNRKDLLLEKNLLVDRVVHNQL